MGLLDIHFLEFGINLMEDLDETQTQMRCHTTVELFGTDKVPMGGGKYLDCLDSHTFQKN